MTWSIRFAHLITPKLALDLRRLRLTGTPRETGHDGDILCLREISRIMRTYSTHFMKSIELNITMQFMSW